MSEPMFPTIRAILNEVLGEPEEEPAEVQDMRRWAREPMRDDNTNVV